MPSAGRYIVKDSHPALKKSARGPITGRIYNSEYAERPGGIHIEELEFGMKMALLSITDDKPDTLKNVGKMNPWQIKSMEILTGSTSKAHGKLTDILSDTFDLTLDTHIDISGLSKAGHALDTQGFIAHNDECIVLSYRCTTSASDWITNLTTTTSAWEIDEDVEQGHSGLWSCWSGFCSKGPPAPRVHTGFYNNFLVTVPLLREYLDVLLDDSQPARTLYVCGHSLGAGIATMAACYYLLEGFDWKNSPHKLRIITAGGPRAMCTSMAKRMDEKLANLKSSNAAIFMRCVRDKDTVANVPPAWLGFRHVDSLVFITKETNDTSTILINPNLKNVAKKRTVKKLLEEIPELYGNPAPRSMLPQDSSSSDESDKRIVATGEEIEIKNEIDDGPTAYEKQLAMIPRPLRDHMPEFYILPLMALNDSIKITKSRDSDTSSLRQMYGYQTLPTKSEDNGEKEPKKKGFFGGLGKS